MNCDSKVNKFFANSGDMNGNFKLRQGDLATLSGRKLSQSDPMLLNSVEGIITANRVTGYYQVMMIMMMMKRVTVYYQLPPRSQNRTSVNLWEQQSEGPGLRRQTTWHKLLDHGEEEEEEQGPEEIVEKGEQNGAVVRLFGKDSTLVIDQITSTV